MIRTPLVATVMSLGAASAANPSIPWNVFTFLFASGVGVYTWFTNRQAATAQDVQKVANSHAVLSERVKHLPTTKDVHELSLSVKELDGSVKSLTLMFRGLRERDKLQDEFLKSLRQEES